MRLQYISQVVSRLGESPIYDHINEEVVWTDISGLKWIKHNLHSGETTVHKSGGMIGAIAIREKGGYIAAVKEGFATVDEIEGCLVTNAILNQNERMNDGKCDTKGRFWAGSTYLDFEKGKGKLYKLETNFQSEMMLEGLTLPNGMDWSLDSRHFYIIDSLEYKLWQFDFELESGQISNRVVLHEFDPKNGIPDGLSISSDGRIVVAMYEGSSIQVISPNGVLMEIIQLPVKNPTSCTFIGKNLENLIVTSASTDDTDDDSSINGKTLLLLELGFKGKKSNYFRG